MSVSIRASCLVIICFHTHSGFERIIKNSFLLPLPEMGRGVVHSDPPRRAPKGQARSTPADNYLYFHEYRGYTDLSRLFS